jgi:hypothetical protein
MKDGSRKDGALKSADANGITMVSRSTDVQVPFDEIKETKVIFSFNKKVHG